MNSEQKIKVIELRKKGKSYKYICKELKLNVLKSAFELMEIAKIIDKKINLN